MGQQLLHWNGKTWSKVASPSLPGGDELYGVSAASGTSAWAVGSYDSIAETHPLLLRWNGKSWSN